jgi:AraC-like DNA-binding protein
MDSQELRTQPVPHRIQRALKAVVPGLADGPLSYAELFEIGRRANVPDDLALEAGRDFDIGDYGILGYAMMSAATLAQAVQIAIKYHRTAEPLLHVSMRTDDQHVYVLLENSFQLDLAFYRAVVEEVLATFPALLETLTGQPVLPVAVKLAFPDPGHGATYVRVFGCAPEFDAVETSYVISRASMSLPLIKADASNFALLEQSCRELLDEIRGAHNFTNSVREVLLREVSSLNTARDVGAFLNISERTLRRKLAQENTAFHDLLDDVRARLAKDYLASTELNAQEIAELLGYTESTNFRRAFARWTSVTPQRYRNEARA